MGTSWKEHCRNMCSYLGDCSQGWRWTLCLSLWTSAPTRLRWVAVCSWVYKFSLSNMTGFCCFCLFFRCGNRYYPLDRQCALLTEIFRDCGFWSRPCGIHSAREITCSWSWIYFLTNHPFQAGLDQAIFIFMFSAPDWSAGLAASHNLRHFQIL